MWFEIQWLTIIAFIIIIVLISIQQIGVKKLITFYMRLLAFTDRRIKFLN